MQEEKAPPLWYKLHVLLEEKFRKFSFLVTLTYVICSVATVQVREDFLKELGELDLEGWQSRKGRPSMQGNSISKAWVQGGHGLLIRKSGCQRARKGRPRTFISHSYVS